MIAFSTRKQRLSLCLGWHATPTYTRLAHIATLAGRDKTALHDITIRLQASGCTKSIALYLMRSIWCGCKRRPTSLAHMPSRMQFLPMLTISITSSYGRPRTFSNAHSCRSSVWSNMRPNMRPRTTKVTSILRVAAFTNCLCSFCHAWFLCVRALGSNYLVCTARV